MEQKVESPIIIVQYHFLPFPLLSNTRELEKISKSRQTVTRIERKDNRISLKHVIRIEYVKCVIYGIEGRMSNYNHPIPLPSILFLSNTRESGEMSTCRQSVTRIERKNNRVSLKHVIWIGYVKYNLRNKYINVQLQSSDTTSFDFITF